MRTAFIGDIGGHRDELARALAALGVNCTSGALPADLTICLLGDLVHRGPDSLGVLLLVEALLSGPDGDRVLPLLGNHETVHLFKSAGGMRWREELPPQVGQMLRSWYRSGVLRWAAAFASADHGPLLATHAGLTAGLWAKLGPPRTADQAEKEIAGAGVKQLTAYGSMLLGGPGNYAAGLVWAEAGWELYPSWVELATAGRPVPFGQVHGHTSAWHWDQQRWDADQQVRPLLQLDANRRHVTATIGGRFFAGVDPCFGTRAHHQWAPLVLEDCHLTA